jgi:ribosome recycling factor
MSSDDILLDAEERMEKAVAVLSDDLRGIRTGQATPGLVDSIRVEYYGSSTPLKQLASVATPEAQLIVIRPFDPQTIKEIEKAILASDVGLTPNSDGRVIRLNVPPLSTERRRQMVTRVKELAENARVAIRNIRRDANKHADQEQKDKVLTEDERDRCKDDIQELTKTYEGKVNELAEKKEREIMED